jgi:F-type H+-transporting ATPase subunit a
LEQETVQPKKSGKNSILWGILILVVVGIVSSRYFHAVLPHVQLPPENLTEHPLISLPILGDVYFTNTMVAMVLLDIILLLIAFSVQKYIQSGNLVPKGIPGAIEAILEYLYSMTEATTGAKWAKEVFPFFAIPMLTLLVANWMELIPGVDSIGLLHASAEHGYPVKQLIPGIATIIEGEAAHGHGFGVIPFVRTLTTDLNFTVALALFSVVMVQVIGIRAQGGHYFTKFFNFPALKKNAGMGSIYFVVGLLELVSEFSKILSFSFRLFGNIFAGTIMLFVIGTLVPVLAQTIFLGLEVFVGLIQAFVFGMLTMLFMAQTLHAHE